MMRAFLLASVMVLGWWGTGHAAPYTAAYVFGDSLSDNGNLAEAYGRSNFPNLPNYHDSFSNGPVANELLAGALGLSLGPSLWVTGFQDIHGLFGGASYVPGTNYAVAGATASGQVSGASGIDLPQQVAAYTSYVSGTADPNALYVVEIGGNDVRGAVLQGTGSSAVTAGVLAELQAVQALVADGARNLLVINVPDVGVIPELAQDHPTLAGYATLLSQQYDAGLATGLSSLSLPTGTTLTQFDLYGYNTGLLASATSLGFTDTTDRCFTATPFSAATTPQCGPDGANIGQFLYWDSVHPTGRVQALWAAGFESAIGASSLVTDVPEPGSLALLGLAAVGIVALRRRKLA